MPGLFICFEKVDTHRARITSTATVLDQDDYGRQLAAEGRSFFYVPMDGHGGWFELDDAGNVIGMHTREAFAGALNKAEVAMLEVATIPAVPACTVTFSGPAVAQTVQHPGGDLKMRFALPGTYTIAFEAFPLLPFEARLTVRQPITLKPEILK